MITIEFTETGIPYSDFNIRNKAKELCELNSENTNSAYQVSTENMIYAMRLMVLQGEISYEQLQFKFNNEIISVDELGDMSKWPMGFCDATQFILRDIVKSQIEKRKEKRNEAIRHNGDKESNNG